MRVILCRLSVTLEKLKVMWHPNFGFGFVSHKEWVRFCDRHEEKKHT